MSTTEDSARTISTEMVWEMADLGGKGWYFRKDSAENLEFADTRECVRQRLRTLAWALTWPECHTAIPYAHR